MHALTISASPVPPFRLDLTVLALRRRPVNAMDTWNGEIYTRVLAIDDIPVLVHVAQSGGRRSPRLHIKAQAHRMPRDARARILVSLERLLGLRVNLRPFYRLAKTDRRLNGLVQRFVGVKPPRFPSVFESIVNGIACQQLSLHVGLTLLNRLAACIGVPFQTPDGTRYAFPRPQDVSECPMRVLRPLGFSTNKGIALKQTSQEIADGQFDPEALSGLRNEEAIERLLTLRGIGRWTAEYVLLRGLGRTDVFPADDVGARNRLARRLNVDGTLDYGSVKQKLARWQPYSGLIYFHLLLDGLETPHLAERDQTGASKMIKLKRVYEPTASGDGTRFLVERLWPRGVKRSALQMDSWLKDVAPSAGLRQWFGHDPAKWSDFRERYFRELRANPGAVEPIIAAAKRGTITLLYSSHDTKHNNAVALMEYVGRRMRRKIASKVAAAKRRNEH